MGSKSVKSSTRNAGTEYSVNSFFRADKRYPLYSVEEIVEFMDTELVFGKEYPHSYFNDDCLGLLLDRIHEAGCTNLFSIIVSQVFAKFKLQTLKLLLILRVLNLILKNSLKD